MSNYDEHFAMSKYASSADRSAAMLAELERLKTALNRYSSDEIRLTHQSTIAAQQEQIERLTAERNALRAFIASDAWAITYQTIGQYRTALLRKIDGARKDEE